MAGRRRHLRGSLRQRLRVAALPAARFGQRAATAFVATPDRRAACADQLGQRRLRFYHNDVGLFAIDSGDLTTAPEHLSLSTGYYRDAEDMESLSIGLQNSADSLGYLGHIRLARDAALESFACAEATDTPQETGDARVYLGWVADLAGDVAEAKHQLPPLIRCGSKMTMMMRVLTCTRVCGTLWADWLARTGRSSPARALTNRNAEICRSNGWNADAARCDRMLGRLDLAAGDTAAAGEHLAAAAAVFRDSDYLTELAITLADLAEHTRVGGNLDGAERYAGEAITIAAPRGLVPAQCAALAARARIRATGHDHSGLRPAVSGP